MRLILPQGVAENGTGGAQTLVGALVVNFSANHGQYRFEAVDLLDRNFQQIAIEDNEIRLFDKNRPQHFGRIHHAAAALQAAKGAKKSDLTHPPSISSLPRGRSIGRCYAGENDSKFVTKSNDSRA